MRLTCFAIIFAWLLSAAALGQQRRSAHRGRNERERHRGSRVALH